MARLTSVLLSLFSTSCGLQMTAGQYADQFNTEPDIVPASWDRTLMHLGLPDADSLVIWYGRAAGSPAPRDVQVSLVGPEGAVPNPAFVHQPLLAAGRLRVTGLRPNTRYEVHVRLDGTEMQTLHARTALEASSAEPFSVLARSEALEDPDRERLDAPGQEDRDDDLVE